MNLQLEPVICYPVVRPLLNWRNKKLKSKLHSVHICVYIPRQSRRYYPVKLPLKVSLGQWSGRDGAWISNSHPFAFEINSRITELKSKINDLTKRFYLQNKTVSFADLEKEIFRKGDRRIFNDYLRQYIRKPPANVKLDDVTWEKYTSFLKHLDNFSPKLRFSEIDSEMVANIRNYLAEQRGQKGKLQAATIKSYFDKFKVVLNYAAKKDHLIDPKDVEEMFEDVTISIPKRKEGQHLEIEELQRLRALTFDAGFYYNDMQVLQKTQLFKDIEFGDYIIGERDKNGNPTIIPLFKFPYATEIINRYADKDPAQALLFRKSTFIEVQAYNRNLKLIAKRARIIRPMSNKTARHTNAQMWIRFGAERQVVSKMMGHEKEQTTENYYKVNLRDVIEGTKSVDFGRFGI